MLADKGYQGIQELCRAIIPMKRPPRGVLSLSDEAFNRSVSSDRILVENYFGRLSCLWSLFAVKLRLCLGLYDDYLHVAVALTNFHTKSHPLRQQDGDKYIQLHNRLLHIANEKLENRRKVLAGYHERRRRCLNHQFRGTQFGDHNTQGSAE